MAGKDILLRKTLFSGIPTAGCFCQEALCGSNATAKGWQRVEPVRPGE